MPDDLTRDRPNRKIAANDRIEPSLSLGSSEMFLGEQSWMLNKRTDISTLDKEISPILINDGE